MATKSLYTGAVLAPMVRCGTTPLRVLALRFGADTVWSEEIIDKKLATCKRVENKEMQSIDFVCYADGKDVVVLRISCLEKERLICQFGSATPESALAAAKLIENDCSGIDINMGCPLKFSVKGGMGSALLKKPDTAEAIVRTLAENCKIPVSAKIRLLKTMDETIAFAKRLAEAGASCITLHMRRPSERDRDPAHWDMIAPLVEALHPVPVLANGDMYRWPDIEELRVKAKVAGSMLGRPALLNLSMFRRELITNHQDEAAVSTENQVENSTKAKWKGLPLLPIDKVVICYIEECIRWDLIYQFAKYTVVEMLNTRRHQKRFYDRKVHLQGREMLDVSRTNSLRELGQLFGIDEQRYNEIVAQRSSITPKEWDALQLAKINQFSAEVSPDDESAYSVNIPAPPPPSNTETNMGESSSYHKQAVAIVSSASQESTVIQSPEVADEEGEEPSLKKSKV